MNTNMKKAEQTALRISDPIETDNGSLAVRLTVCDAPRFGIVLEVLKELNRALSSSDSGAQATVISRIRAALDVGTDKDANTRLEQRLEQIFEEFGAFTLPELIEHLKPRIKNPRALVINWKMQKKIFATPSARGEVFLAFQFRNFAPLDVVGEVLKEMGNDFPQGSAALWFCSNNVYLPDSKRPADLMTSDPEAVLLAAKKVVIDVNPV